MPGVPYRLVAGGIGLLLALGALAWLIGSRNHWKAEAAARGARIERICALTRDAAGNPKLNCRDVELQVAQLGKALGELKRALANQNAAVAALGAQSATAQRQAAQAAQEARQRAEAAAKVSTDLGASSRAPQRAAAPCEPSETLKEAWR